MSEAGRLRGVDLADVPARIEADGNLSELNDRAELQRGLGHVHSVQHGAVATAEIAHPYAPLLQPKLRVAARDAAVAQAQVATRIRAHRHERREASLQALRGPVQDDQLDGI